ncbi:homoserine dehydrogenase [Pedobacter cryoconitis]|uniref:Homoserine dehydrogenase n=1 Tax=Pedobacter cryoconitis TaxID=188932 RepID=A0A127V9I4_9SPHI|nr:homoserine dehydrogenase [Pedobacter cryoconitis]AMP97964.1 homoserine dehydrogenase [Pedobacter cryoconitis]
MKRTKIGIFGLGVVGKGVYDLLKGMPEFEVGAIVVKDKFKPRNIDEKIITYDKHDILDDLDTDIVIELIDDAEEAYDIVTTSLKKGKAVISANKKMISAHLRELITLQKDTQTQFLYEGAVCGSIPIIKNLEDYYANDNVLSLTGIVNGSTNYLLTKAFEEKVPFSEIVHRAKELGYLESDPSLDINGYDARSKLKILIAHAFGKIVELDSILMIGIQNISDADIDFAKDQNLKIKLIAKSYSHEGNHINLVVPMFISDQSDFNPINDVFNGVVLNSQLSDKHIYIGRGAGSLPTAVSIIQDLFLIKQQYSYAYKKLEKTTDFSINYPSYKIYISYSTTNHLLSEVEQHFSNVIRKGVLNNNSYIIGEMKHEELCHVQHKYEGAGISAILFDTIQPNNQ